MEGFLLLIIIVLLIYIATTRKKPEKKRGCLSKVAVSIAFVYVIFSFLLFIGSSDSPSSSNSEKASSTPRVTTTANATKTENPTATARAKASKTQNQTTTANPTKTPKPTATPKPTPTPVPDFSSMTLESAANELAKYFAGTAFVHKSTDVIEGGICLEMTMKPFATEKHAVINCCKFALNVSEHLFQNPDAKSLVIYYDTDGRDAYGNETTVRAMDILLYASTAKKINYDYMRDSLWTSTKRFLSITDRYYVHPSLSNGVYDK